MEEAGNIGSCSEGIGQVATRNRADKVSKEGKDLTHLTSINSHKVVHLWEIGAHSFSNNFFVANCQTSQESSFSSFSLCSRQL